LDIYLLAHADSLPDGEPVVKNFTKFTTVSVLVFIAMWLNTGFIFGQLKKGPNKESKLEIKRFISGVAIATSIFLTACSTVDEEESIRGTERGIYEQAQAHMRGENYPSAVRKLQLLESRFPFGKYAEQAQLELIYAHYRSGDFAEAMAAADRFIRLHPRHENVDYAYYVKGLAAFTDGASIFDRFIPGDVANRDPGPALQSFSAFSELLSRYPNSNFAADARARMVYLRNLLARHEIHVANYYFKRRAFVSALRRGQYVVENFPKTPAVADGLAVMIQAYKSLGLNEQANTSLAVLKLNFPDYPAIDAAGDFISEFDVDGNRSFVNQLSFGFIDPPNPPRFDTSDIYGG
jgi:outer membrane protein assembly factor BamD